MGKMGGLARFKQCNLYLVRTIKKGLANEALILRRQPVNKEIASPKSPTCHFSFRLEK